MIPRVITPPTFEQITLAEAREHCDLYDDTEETDLLTRLIKGSRQYLERYTGRRLATQTLQLTLDEFPTAIKLTGSPIQSVESVKYDDADGAEQTLDPADYYLDNESEPGWLTPNVGKAWPATYARANAVRVQYIAGYGNLLGSPLVYPIPEDLRAAQFLMLRHLYDSRGSESAPVPTGVKELARNYRILTGMA
jgi:uncharacterized phiE125 gp8 family phage protein